jgi:hypothetical protein
LRDAAKALESFENDAIYQADIKPDRELGGGRRDGGRSLESRITFRGDLTEEAGHLLLEIADRSCPVLVVDSLILHCLSDVVAGNDARGRAVGIGYLGRSFVDRLCGYVARLRLRCRQRNWRRLLCGRGLRVVSRRNKLVGDFVKRVGEREGRFDPGRTRRFLEMGRRRSDRGAAGGGDRQRRRSGHLAPPWSGLLRQFVGSPSVVCGGSTRFGLR